jgi:hypothetical protein
MDKPYNECVIVPPTNNVAFAMYATMSNFCSLFSSLKKSWMALMTYVFPILITPPTCCNICFVEFICVNFSNA